MQKMNLGFTEMEAAIKKLNTLAGDFDTVVTSMSTEVSKLCSNWDATSSKTYEADYKKLTKNYKQTTTVVKELTKSADKYVKDMKKLDAAYNKSKVSSN